MSLCQWKMWQQAQYHLVIFFVGRWVLITNQVLSLLHTHLFHNEPEPSLKLLNFIIVTLTCKINSSFTHICGDMESNIGGSRKSNYRLPFSHALSENWYSGFATWIFKTNPSMSQDIQRHKFHHNIFSFYYKLPSFSRDIHHLAMTDFKHCHFLLMSIATLPHTLWLGATRGGIYLKSQENNIVNNFPWNTTFNINGI